MDQIDEAQTNHRRRASCVRFNEKEYTRIEEDAITTGKSIPTLLKERYFKGPRPLPLVSHADLTTLAGEICRISTHLGQLTKHLNSGIREGFVPQLTTIEETVTKLLTFMVGTYCRCKKVS